MLQRPPTFPIRLLELKLVYTCWFVFQDANIEIMSDVGSVGSRKLYQFVLLHRTGPVKTEPNCKSEW